MKRQKGKKGLLTLNENAVFRPIYIFMRMIIYALTRAGRDKYIITKKFI